MEEMVSVKHQTVVVIESFCCGLFQPTYANAADPHVNTQKEQKPSCVWHLALPFYHRSTDTNTNTHTLGDAIRSLTTALGL